MFLTWAINFLKVLNGMLSRLGFPSTEYSVLTSQRDDFSAKLTLAEEPATRTKVTIMNKNLARKLFEKTIRGDIKEFLNFNRNLTEGDREALALPVYKTGRTPAKIAEEHPDYDIDNSEIRRSYSSSTKAIAGKGFISFSAGKTPAAKKDPGVKLFRL
jgi:hypothetical protein